MSGSPCYDENHKEEVRIEQGEVTHLMEQEMALDIGIPQLRISQQLPGGCFIVRFED